MTAAPPTPAPGPPRPGGMRRPSPWHGLRRILACLVVAAAAAGPARAAEAPRPNILFIVADDLGWSDVGWHGGFGRTPHLDGLVREGVELDRHYVQPVCTPTRVALLTGRYPGRFGPHAIAPSNRRALPPGTATLASVLRAAGYATFQTGKWHLGSRPEWGPNAFGFDHAYGTLTGAADPWTHAYRAGPYERTWHRDGARVDEAGNATELVTAEGERRIRELGGAGPAGERRPWFGYVAFHAVHTPVDAPEAFKAPYAGVVFDADPARHDSRLRMAAMVSQLDAAVGRLVTALEETGQREETLIVFTSDNGGIESLANAYVGDVADSPLNSDNNPLRGQKNTLWEGGVRVCAFANWPGVLAPRKCNAVVHAADWFPSLVAALGLDAGAGLEWDGVDRWGAIAGTAPAARDRPLCIVHSSGRAVYEGDWKLILQRKGGATLFDLAADPFESADVADAHPEVVARLRAIAAADAERDVRELPADLADVPN